MRALWASLLALLLVGACAPQRLAPALTPLPTLQATLRPTAPRAGLLLVALEGVREHELRTWLDEGALPYLTTLVERGRLASLTPPEPTLPDLALRALLAGQSGAEAPPFWQAQPGYASALVGAWPGGGPAQADFGLAPTEPQVDPALHEPRLLPAQGWVDAPPSFSPRLEATLEVQHKGQPVATLYLLAVDTRNDNTVDYDEYWLAPTRHIGPTAVRLQAGGTEAASLRVSEAVGVDWYLLEGQADQLRLYQSAASLTQVWPEALAERLPPALQIYPAPPDLRAYRQGWLDVYELQQMAQYQTLWLAEASAWLWQQLPTDRVPILATRWSAPGQLQAALLLVDPTQRPWQRLHPPTLLAVRRATLADSEAALRRLLSQVDLSQHTLFVTSPLGLDPIRRQLSLPTLLARSDIEYRLRGEVAWLRPPLEARAEVEQRLRTALDPATQQPLLAAVVWEDEGWLRVQAQSGTLLSAEPGEALLAPTTQLAATGGPASSPDLAGWWLAVGHRILPGSASEGALPLPHVGATAAYLLALPPPGDDLPMMDWLYDDGP